MDIDELSSQKAELSSAGKECLKQFSQTLENTIQYICISNVAETITHGN